MKSKGGLVVEAGSSTTGLRLVGIQNAKGKTFARRVELTDAQGLTRTGQDRTRALLSRAIELANRKSAGSRLVVAVDAKDVKVDAGVYLQMLMQAPDAVRKQLMLQIEGTDFGMCAALGEFCSFAQNRCGVGMMLKVDECSEEDLDSLLFVTTASILCLGRVVTERTRSCRHRIEVLDAIEIANVCGACVMMEGIDTEAERDHVFRLGVTLATGKAICEDELVVSGPQQQRVTTPQEFVSKLTMMA